MDRGLCRGTSLNQVLTAFIADHIFPSVDLQREVLRSAGFALREVQPVCRGEEDVVAKCAQADLLFVQFAPITRRVLYSLPHLRGIVRYGIGVDNIDLAAARELGVAVANVPAYSVEEVSNHTIAMVLSLSRRIAHDHYRISHGEWGVAPLGSIPTASDLILGLVGFGTIARRVSEKARVFGFHVVSFDPYLSDATFADHHVKRSDWETLLTSADIISLHCPLTPETTHLINNETITKMRAAC